MKLVKTPRQVDIAVTTKCNLRCDYCSHFTSAGDVGEDLGAEEWTRFIEELGRLAVLRVTLEGGEPFARDDLDRIVKAIVDNRMRFSILSNGTTIEDRDAKLLASTGRCDGVQVSIDGSGAASHDAFRGKGSFEAAARGIETLIENNVPVTVRVTIHKQNIADLEAIAELLLDRIGIPGFSTNSASHLGLCRQNAAKIELDVGERSRAMDGFERLIKKYGDRVSGAAGPLAERRNWMEMERARLEGRDGLPGRGRLTSCGGVFQKLAVRADGTIVPCIQMSHLELGRVNQEPLDEIWRDHPELVRLRDRRGTPLSSFEFCKGCEYIDYCSGGCPAMAHARLGRDDRPDPDSCLKRFLAAGGTLPGPG